MTDQANSNPKAARSPGGPSHEGHLFCHRRKCRRSPGDLETRRAEGHEIANHSWSHPNFGKMSDEAVRRELRENGRSDQARDRRPAHFVAAALWFDHRAAKNWIHDDIWLPDHHLGCRSAGLETARSKRGLQSHCERNAARLDCFVARYSSGTIEAMPATFDQLRSERIQVRHRFGTCSPWPARYRQSRANDSLARRHPAPAGSPHGSPAPGDSKASLSRHDRRSLPAASD